MDLRIPGLRDESYFPSLLEPRRRSERALLAVFQQAYIEGVIDSFLARSLDGGPYCYLWLDAMSQKVREEGRLVNVSVAVATAADAEGKREIVSMDSLIEALSLNPI